MNKTAYVYSMTIDGHVIERAGIVGRRTAKSVIITVNGGQRVLCDRKPGVISGDKMWSTYACRGVYVQKMLDVLLARRAVYQDRLESTAKRINNLKAG